ncbi:MAG: ornithine carbamoyltransferase [Synergistaceae bacterium]|jgi:ornithine carbamoyltransferase|nr:ornithine carbamoyltransferase [Synergistaceae bacterium]
MALNLHGRNFLTLKDFTTQEIEFLLDLSADLKAKKRVRTWNPLLRGRNVALIFEKASTRTRCAFTVAAIDEGGHPEYLSKNDIHLGAKEDTKDTARVLGRMFDGIQFRGFKHSTVEELAKYAGVPVWNGLTDEYHPTQILADMLTVREHLGGFKGRKLVYVGDARNNMGNSLMIGCAKLGLHYVASAHPSLLPADERIAECRKIAEESFSGGTVETETDPRKAVKDADVIYTDVWYSMGEEEKAAERKALLSAYQVNMDLFKATGKRDTIFMHCLPAYKGNEVTEDVFEHPNSKVFDEAENRMHTIKAVMVATIGDI